MYEQNGIKLCLPADQCQAKDGYKTGDNNDCVKDTAKCYQIPEGECVSAADCISDTNNGYLYDDGTDKKCLTADQCQTEDGHYVFASDDGAEKLCLSETTCKTDKHGYTFDYECLTKDQCEKRTDHGKTYEAKSGVCKVKHPCGDDKYVTEDRACVTHDQCTTEQNKLIYETPLDRMCLTTDECA